MNIPIIANTILFGDIDPTPSRCVVLFRTGHGASHELYMTEIPETLDDCTYEDAVLVVADVANRFPTCASQEERLC